MHLWGHDLKNFTAPRPSLMKRVCFWAWAAVALLVWGLVFGIYAYQCCVFWGWLP